MLFGAMPIVLSRARRGGEGFWGAAWGMGCGECGREGNIGLRAPERSGHVAEQRQETRCRGEVHSSVTVCEIICWVYRELFRYFCVRISPCSVTVCFWELCVSTRVSYHCRLGDVQVVSRLTKISIIYFQLNLTFHNV